jgi:hypothetical protein
MDDVTLQESCNSKSSSFMTICAQRVLGKRRCGFIRSSLLSRRHFQPEHLILTVLPNRQDFELRSGERDGQAKGLRLLCLNILEV